MENLIYLLDPILKYWNSFLLSWGLFIWCSHLPNLKELWNDKKVLHCQDIVGFGCVSFFNVLLTLYLFVAPKFFVDFSADAIIVIDVGYTLLLSYISYGFYKWLEQKNQLNKAVPQQSPPTTLLQ